MKKYLEKKLEQSNQVIQPVNVFSDENKEKLKEKLDNNTENLSDYSNIKIFNPEFNEPVCVYCNKRFMTNSHRNRHMNSNCVVRKKYIDLIKTLDSEYDSFYLENKFLRNKYMSLFGEQYLFAFGTEKFSGYEMYLVADVIKNPYKGIPDFIEAYHFNPLESRYNNVRIKNPRGGHLEVFNGKNWVIESKETVIQTLLRTYKDIVDMEVENFSKTIHQSLIKNYNDFSEYVDYYLSFLIYDSEIPLIYKRNAKPIYHKIYTAIELMLINTVRKNKDIYCKIEEEITNLKSKNE